MLRLLLAAGLAVLSACGRGPDPAPAGSRPAPPHLLLIVGDDAGAELGCYGAVGLATPHLDQLAREGLRFSHAFAPTGICAPSRATLLTGLEPARHGALGFEPVRADVLTFGEALGAAGYRTGLLGKVGVRPVERFPFDWIERTLPGDEGARDVEFHARAAAAFFAGADARPMALVVNLRDAHWPLPTDGAPPRPGEPAAPHDPQSVGVPPVLVDGPETRAELARYHDALRRMDATVGALLEVLAAEGLSERTLVVYTSDNGPPFPRGKTTLYEWGVRVALIARGPGVAGRGRVDESLVTLADILPTCLELAGWPAERRAGFDGRSLAPLLSGEAPKEPWRAAVFGVHGSHRAGEEVPARSIRDARWRYIWNPHPERRFESLAMGVSAAWAELVAASERGVPHAVARVAGLVQRPAEELYDLTADPWELTNRAGDPEAEAVRARLRRELEAHLAAQGDPLAR